MRLSRSSNEECRVDANVRARVVEWAGGARRAAGASCWTRQDESCRTQQRGLSFRAQLQVLPTAAADAFGSSAKMASQLPVLDRDTLFAKLMVKKDNRACFDCGTANPKWCGFKTRV